MKVFYTLLAFLICQIVVGQDATIPKESEKGELHAKSSTSVRVFVLAGQSNMQGQGKIYDGANGAIGVVMDSFTPSCDDLGTETCEFTFNMLDGYGDGWNGWTYDFVQDGTVMATETLDSGLEGTSTVTLQGGVLCEVVVNLPGAYGAEISWTLTDSFGEVVASMDGQPDDYPSPNTLVDVMENNDNNEFPMLLVDDEWVIFEDAYIHFENGDNTVIQDHVTVGQGAFPHLIGPELMFAYQMDEYFDDPVLIIKTAWGGLSLGEDFRPPSAGGTTGPYYNEMIDIVENVTQNLGDQFPDIGIVDFELSGFAWFQGWNDAGSEDFLNNYASNLHHLINDVRTDLGAPDLPIVVASAGQGGYEDHWGWTEDVQDIIAVAQEDVACDDILYGGTVGFVDTKPLYMSMLESPDDAGFHYHNNARTFLNVGKHIGEEMIRAMNDMAYCEGFVSVDEKDHLANAISLFPNPASSQLTIEHPEWDGQITEVLIYNSAGTVVCKEKLASNQPIDVSRLAQGIYMVELHIGEAFWRSRVVVE